MSASRDASDAAFPVLVDASEQIRRVAGIESAVRRRCEKGTHGCQSESSAEVKKNAGPGSSDSIEVGLCREPGPG
jgi:hypothetical protein